jgi:hypothetical protein
VNFSHGLHGQSGVLQYFDRLRRELIDLARKFNLTQSETVFAITYMTILQIKGVERGSGHDKGSAAKLRAPFSWVDQLIVHIPEVKLEQTGILMPEDFSAVIRQNRRVVEIVRGDSCGLSII